jgi:hypothetical protein
MISYTELDEEWGQVIPFITDLDEKNSSNNIGQMLRQSEHFQR